MASENPYQTSYNHGEPEYDPPLTPEVTNWAMLCHLSALIGLALGGVMFLGPLIVWLLKRNDHPFIDEQGKESLNFQISMMIYGVVALALICVAIGFFLLPALAVLDIIFVIIASVKVSSGENYRYPLTIRLIR